MHGSANGDEEGIDGDGDGDDQEQAEDSADNDNDNNDDADRTSNGREDCDENEDDTETENEETENDTESEEDEVAPQGNHDNRRENNQGDELLYEGANLTVHEAVLSVFAFALSANLCNAVISKLLSLISLLLPAGHLFTRTIYKFLQFFNDEKTPLIRHYFCDQCFTAMINMRPQCGCKNISMKTFFIEIPVIEQLQSLLMTPGFIEDISYPYTRVKCMPDNIEDIFDGELYKEYVQSKNAELNKFNLSCMWYSDGLPIFKSRKMSVWPFCLIINELPYAKRIKKENIIMAGIWCAPMDPPVNLFLHPIILQLLRLQTGVEMYLPNSNELITLQLHLICGTCDTPARADFLNHIRFNGNYGCTRCYAQGCSVSGEDFGHAHIYPFKNDEVTNVSRYYYPCKNSR